MKGAACCCQSDKEPKMNLVKSMVAILFVILCFATAFAGQTYLVHCNNLFCRFEDTVSIGGGFSFGETAGYCPDCKEFVNIRWKLKFPPTPVGHVYNDFQKENIPVYACPKCGSPFREIKFPEDLIHCPRCGMESIEKWGIFLYD